MPLRSLLNLSPLTLLIHSSFRMHYLGKRLWAFALSMPHVLLFTSIRSPLSLQGTSEKQSQPILSVPVVKDHKSR